MAVNEVKVVNSRVIYLNNNLYSYCISTLAKTNPRAFPELLQYVTVDY